MPVKRCANGKYRIGNGKCVYKTRAKADRAYRGYLAIGGEGMKNEAIELSDKELKATLDSRIRRSAAYKIRNNDYGLMNGVNLGLTPADGEGVDKLVQAVYDDIIDDMMYSDNTVKAIRSVKFSKAYVKRVVSAAIKGGSLRVEVVVQDAVELMLGRALIQEKAKLGSGGRFKALVRKLKKGRKGKPGKSEKRAKAIAAAIGRKKHGSKRMAKWAVKGRKKKK